MVAIITWRVPGYDQSLHRGRTVARAPSGRGRETGRRKDGKEAAAAVAEKERARGGLSERERRSGKAQKGKERARKREAGNGTYRIGAASSEREKGLGGEGPRIGTHLPHLEAGKGDRPEDGRHDFGCGRQFA